MNRKDLAGKRFNREILLEARAINEIDRTVSASLSSELPVRRWWGKEILVHEQASIDLERAADGLPLLWQHNGDQPIGIVENITIDGRKLRGQLRFSENPKAQEVFHDMRQGFLKNISIGYTVNKWEEESDSDTVRVTHWSLLETSVVTVPADHTVGIGRSMVRTMDDEEKSVIDITALSREHLAAKKAGAAEAVQSERKRIVELDSLFQLGAVNQLDRDFAASLRMQAMDQGWGIDQTRTVLLQALSDQSTPVIDYARLSDTPTAPSVERKPLARTVQMGKDEAEKFAEGIEHALLVRAGIRTSREEIAKAREGGFIGKSMKSMAGDFLRSINMPTNSLSDEAVVTRAMNYRASGQTTSDFTNILANVASKSLLQGWDEAPETWQIISRRGQLPDFKTADISGISGFTGLDEVAEDGDISYGKFTDRKETIKLVQYAKKYRLSRQAVINDDLRAFSAVPRAMGRAANRKVGDVTYAIFASTGPTLNQDGLALFHANHSNYVLAATAPTVATLNTATTAMMKQTDPNTAATLNIRPRYLLVPPALYATARVLMAATYDPAATAGTLVPNPFSGAYEVVTDARLEGQVSGAAAWYLLADPNVFDTIEVAFLDGVAEPYMRENPDWAGQGIEYVVGVDFGVSALDFRGIHKYRGS